MSSAGNARTARTGGCGSQGVVVIYAGGEAGACAVSLDFARVCPQGLQEIA
ncbi:MAG: hypothetical protein HYZ37_05905 [Candidatus Solibacter usitatus]|nr:hypothetical protein [Candidatus Solibacter usitatus]